MSQSRRRRVVSVVRPAPDGGGQTRATVDGLCREALALTSALEMECWVSSLLGQLWEQRGQAPPLELDRAFVLGAPFVEQIARSGRPGARLVLQAIACLDRGGLGTRCGQLADALGRRQPGQPPRQRQRLPSWARDRTGAQVRRAMTTGVPGDGEVLCLEAGGGGRQPHTVAAFIDDRQDRIVKHLHVLGPIDEWAGEALGPGGALGTPGEELAPEAAARRMAEAIRRTDGRPEASVADSFVALRALALARAMAPRAAPEAAAWLN
jgi:hypothetical protein